MMNRFIRRLLFVTLLLWPLAGCTDRNQLQQTLETYQQRLANVLDVPFSPAAPVLPNNFPVIAKGELPSVNLTLLEFDKLKQCNAQILIAERNTPLGRVRLPSQHFIYEIELLSALQQCQLTDPMLQQKIEKITALKQQNFGSVWADFIQQSEAIKISFSSRNGYIQGNADDNLNAVLQAYQYLFKAYESREADSQALEQHLQTLQNAALPARIWRSQKLLQVTLADTTAWLNQHTQNLTCDTVKGKQTMTYLNNVFRLFFIEQIQPVSAQLNHYHYQLKPLLEKFINHPALSSAFKGYITDQLQSFEGYQHAVKEHVQFWQQQYKRCGFTPGG